MFAGTDFRDLALWQKPPNLDQRLWQKGNEKVEIHEGMTKKPPQTMSRTLNLWQSKAWSFHILINSQHLSIAQGSSCLWHDEEDWPMGRQESLRTSTTLTKAPERQSVLQTADLCTFCTMKTWRKWMYHWNSKILYDIILYYYIRNLSCK